MLAVVADRASGHMWLNNIDISCTLPQQHNDLNRDEELKNESKNDEKWDSDYFTFING